MDAAYSANLDDEYNAFIPAAGFDKDAIYRQRSAHALGRVERIADVVYDQRSGSKLDLFPAGPGAPLFVWIHGGYWRSSSKDENIFVAPGLVGQGIAVCTVDYQLAPAVNLDEIVRQVRQAIAWLAANAGDYGIDAGRIHIGGHSAGGHLVGMLLAKGWQEDFDVRDDVVGTALSVSGIFDLAPIEHTFVNKELRLDAGLIQRNSPILHVPGKSAADLLVSYGGRESSEFRRQTEIYEQAWRGNGNSATSIAMPDFHHFDIILELEKPGNPLFDTLVGRIGQAL